MKESIEAFEINATEAYALIAESTFEKNPATGMLKLKAANAKLRAIKAHGLPEDLKEALDAVRVSMRELLSFFDCRSEKPEALMASMQKIGEDLDLLECWCDLSEASGVASFQLKEVANKYGIELPWVSRERLMASFEAQPE